MTITVINTTTDTGRGRSTAVLDVPAGYSEGDLLIAHVTYDGGIDTGMVGHVDWTEHANSPVSDGSVTHHVFYKRALASEAASYTFGTLGATETLNAAMMCLNGITTSDVESELFDQFATNTGSGTAQVCSSITPSVNDCMLIAATAQDGEGVHALATHTQVWNLRQTQATGNASSGGFSLLQGTAEATGDVTITSTVSDGFATVHYAIAPHTGGVTYERTLTEELEVTDHEDRVTQSLRHLLESVDLNEFMIRTLTGAEIIYERTLDDNIELNDLTKTFKLLDRLIQDLYSEGGGTPAPLFADDFNSYADESNLADSPYWDNTSFYQWNQEYDVIVDSGYACRILSSVSYDPYMEVSDSKYDLGTNQSIECMIAGTHISAEILRLVLGAHTENTKGHGAYVWTENANTIHISMIINGISFEKDATGGIGLIDGDYITFQNCGDIYTLYKNGSQVLQWDNVTSAFNEHGGTVGFASTVWSGAAYGVDNFVAYDMDKVFYDGFNRADENLNTHAQWQAYDGGVWTGVLQVSSYQLVQGDADFGASIVNTIAFDFDTDQYVEATVVGSNAGAGDETIGLMLRSGGDDLSNMYVLINPSVDTFKMYSRVNAIVNERDSASVSIDSGDVITFASSGDVFTGYVNDVQELQWTQVTSLITTGQVGVIGYQEAASVFGLDNFKAMNLIDIGEGEVVAGSGIGLTDSMSREIQAIITYLRTLNDNFELIDTTARNLLINHLLSDAFALNDSMSVEKLLLRLLNDAFDLDDSLTREITQIQALIRTLQDSVNLTDTLTRVKRLIRNLVDNVELTDAQLRTLLLIRLLADEFEVNDSLARAVERVKFIILTDQFDVNDTVHTAQWFNHALTDSVELNELVNRRLDILRHLTDNIDLIDSLVAKIAGLVFRTLTEQIDFTDTLSTETILRINRTLTDAVALQETLNRNLLMVRLLSDNVDFTDSLDRWVSEASLIVDRVLVDNFELHELLNRTADVERLLTQTLSIYDALSRTTELKRLLSDNITLNDAIVQSLIRSIFRTLTDQVDVSDNLISTFISALGDIGFIQYLVRKQAIDFKAVHEPIYFDAIDAYPNLEISLLLR